MSGKKKPAACRKTSPQKAKSKNAQSDVGTKVALATVLILLVGLAAATLFYSLSERKEEKKFYKSLNAKVDTVRIPIPHERDQNVKFYSYPLTSSKTIKLFVAKSATSRSLVSVAFEACQDCYKKGRGFQLRGKDLICAHCGQRIKMNEIDQSRKGCNPLPLKSTIEKGRILIRLDDLKQGDQYF